MALASQSEQLEVTPEPSLLKEKNRAISLDHEIVRWDRVKMSQNSTEAKKRKIRTRSWSIKCKFHSKESWETKSQDRDQKGKKGVERIASLEE